MDSTGRLGAAVLELALAEVEVVAVAVVAVAVAEDTENGKTSVIEVAVGDAEDAGEGAVIGVVAITIGRDAMIGDNAIAIAAGRSKTSLVGKRATLDSTTASTTEALEALEAQAMARLRHLPWEDQGRCLPLLADMVAPRLQCTRLLSHRRRLHLQRSR